MEENNGYSPEVLEVLNRKPAWIIRWGILLITVLFVLALTASWFIPYEETISVPLVLKTRVAGDRSTSLWGIARITGADKTQIKTGQAVTISVIPDGSFTPIRLEGSVTAMMPDSTNISFSAEILVAGNQLKRIPSPAREIAATARIPAAHSNLLEQIFRPIRSTFSSSKRTL